MFVFKRKIRNKIQELEELIVKLDSNIDRIKELGFKKGDPSSFCKYNQDIMLNRRLVISTEETIKVLKGLL